MSVARCCIQSACVCIHLVVVSELYDGPQSCRRYSIRLVLFTLLTPGDRELITRRTTSSCRHSTYSMLFVLICFVGITKIRPPNPTHPRQRGARSSSARNLQNSATDPAPRADSTFDDPQPSSCSLANIPRNDRPRSSERTHPDAGSQAR